MSHTVFFRRIWITALLLAWAGDQLFWGHTLGLSFPIWVALALTGLFISAVWQGRRPAWPSYLLAVVSLALSLTSLFRTEPFTFGLAIFLSLCGVGLLAATLLDGYWIFFRVGDTFLAAVRVLGAMLIRGSGGYLNAPAQPASPPVDEQRSGLWQSLRRTFPYLRGALLSLPVLSVLGALLASADPIFASTLKNFFTLFDLDKLPEYFIRGLCVILFGYIYAGVLLHASAPETARKRPDPQQPWNTRFLGSRECFTVLGAVLALFLFFIAIQFRYLFGGQANIRETAFTYSEYARRGFFELVWVAILSIALYLTLSAITNRVSDGAQKAFSYLSIALFVCVLVMLASAFQRLQLYEAAYGFTRLRTYTHILLPWLAVLLLAAILLETFRRPGHFGLAILIFTFGFGLTFSLLNVDGLIASLNLQRARAGGELDVQHLAGLSTDAVPVMAEAFRSTSDPRLRERLGAALACQWVQNQPRQAGNPDWRSLNLSRLRALQTLNTLDLSLYLVQDDSSASWTVQDSSGPVYCYGYAMEIPTYLAIL